MALAETVSAAEVIIPATAGIIGVIVGGIITAYNQRKERQHNRLREKLDKLYAPLVAMRMEIKSKSELRVKLHDLANTAWQSRMAPLRDDLEELTITEKARGPQFDKLYQYSEDQLKDELIPIYRRMVNHLAANIGLAEPSTRSYFDTLVEFVEIWNRALAKSLPGEVRELLEHREGNLKPFYDDIDTQFRKLQQDLET